MEKKVAKLGLYLSLALICSYIESFIPFGFGIPGIKLGLTNIVVVLLMYTLGPKYALLISVFRIVLAGFMFGNVFAIAYSLAGGLLSFLVMVLIKKTGLFKVVSVSILGGIFHNIGQIILASIIVENYNVLFYIPVLLIAGALTGLVIGIISQEILIRIGSRVKL